MLSAQKTKTAGVKNPAMPYVGLEHMASESSDLVGWSRAGSSISTNSVFIAEDVLFGKLRPNLRKCVLAPFVGYCSTDILVLRSREGVHPPFAAKVCQSDAVFREASATAIGTKMPRTSWGAVEGFRVFCPGESEQRRIAAVLDTLDDATRETEDLIAKLKLIKQGLLHDLLTRGVGESGDLRPPSDESPQLYIDSPLGKIPAGWVVAEVGSLLADVDPAMRSGPFGSALLKHELVESGIPLLGIDNVHRERFVPEYARFVSPTKARELSRYRVRPGDVMITIMGTVGRCCLAPEDIGDALSSKHIWTLTLDRQRYSPFLACAQFNHAPWVLAHFSQDEQGGIMSAIRSDTLRSTLLRVPPIPEQHRMEAILAAFDQRFRRETDLANKLRTLKHGLGNDLLTGIVRVPVAEEAAT